MKTKKILFTGGGTAGHVTPNIALIQRFLAEGWAVDYIGSANGVERELIAKLALPYFPVATGKLRRYFSWQNFIDPFKILLGIIQSFFILRKEKPSIVFSKGGFVGFPVVVGAWLNRIPAVIHESDLTPGLANRLSFPFASKICLTFAATQRLIPTKTKAIVTGTPIRQNFFTGEAEKGRKRCGFPANKRVLLIFAGGQGSVHINNVIYQTLPQLLKQFYVVHICGPGKKNAAYLNTQGYHQLEYAHEELFDIMACADIVVSRAGANSLYELLVLKKPHILIPLSKNASRGDQIQNANYTKQQGLSIVIPEEELTADRLLQSISELEQQWPTYHQRLVDFACQDGTNKIFALLNEAY